MLSDGYSVETNLFDLPLHDFNSQITCLGYTCKGDSLQAACDIWFLHFQLNWRYTFQTDTNV